nr:hotdog domain-containing protein [Variovorax boronicumulans]
MSLLAAPACDAPQAATRRGHAIALLDAALVAAALARNPSAQAVDVIDLHLGFVQPHGTGLQAEGQVTGGGRSVCFCEAELRDATGQLVARAMATLRYRPPTSPGA